MSRDRYKFSAEEIERVRELRLAHYSYKEIAKEMGWISPFSGNPNLTKAWFALNKIGVQSEYPLMRPARTPNRALTAQAPKPKRASLGRTLAHISDTLDRIAASLARMEHPPVD